MPLDDWNGLSVATGTYHYAEVAQRIDVVAFGFDYYFELPAQDGRAEWMAHQLNADGRLYYLKPANADPLPNIFQHASEAMTWADAQAWGPVNWSVKDAG